MAKKKTEFIADLDGDLLNTDWIVSARLMRKAKAGDKKAAKELQERDETKMVKGKS